MSDYIPILKWKQGEQQALANLRAEDKAKITPLLEILTDPEEGYAQLAKVIVKSWGGDAPVMLDLGALEHPLIEQAYAQFRETGISAIPVAGVYRDLELQEATAVVCKRDRLGLCLRITPEDIAEPTFEADLDAALETLQVGQGQVDVVFDGGYLLLAPGVSTGSMAFTALGFLQAIPYLDRWRTITYAAGSFPEMLQSVGTGSKDLPRSEWDIWRQLTRRMPKVKFGDYAVAHPRYRESRHTGSAAIRYTVDGHWLIHRGHRLTGGAYGGYEQFHDLSRALQAESCFRGPTFSWGDLYVTQCADRSVSSGNATTWRAVATNHHIAFVVDALASPPATSGIPGR